MTEYVDVKPADVRAGDEVKVDGFGATATHPPEVVDFAGSAWFSIFRMSVDPYVVIQEPYGNAGSRLVNFRRSSITAARRKVEKVVSSEPVLCPVCGQWRHLLGMNEVCKPVIEPPKQEPVKAGTWKHGDGCGTYLRGTTLLGGESDKAKCDFPEVYRADQGWSPDTRSGRPWIIQAGDPVYLDYLPNSGGQAKVRPVDRRKSDRRSKS